MDKVVAITAGTSLVWPACDGVVTAAYELGLPLEPACQASSAHPTALCDELSLIIDNMH